MLLLEDPSHNGLTGFLYMWFALAGFEAQAERKMNNAYILGTETWV